MTRGESVARSVRRVLEHFGTRTVFALAGASQSMLIDELGRHGFTIVPTRHEAATVAAADAYARITGQLGIAMINQDQGLPNAVTGILSAYEACAPVLVLIGRDPEGLLDPEHALQPDTLPLARAVTKAARYVTDPLRVAEYVAGAGCLALAGRPGPTAVCFAEDYLGAAAGPSATPARMIARPPLPAPGPVDIEEAAALLSAARRPVIVAGGGAAWSRAGDALRRLSRQWSIPVLMNATARGLVPEDDRLGWPWPVAQTAVVDSDLVIWAGARRTRRLGYGLPPRFSPTARMIQIDVDAAELGKHRAVTLPIQADVTVTLTALADALTAARVPPGDPRWLTDALAERLAGIAAIAKDAPAAPVHPAALCRGVAQRLTERHLFINDGATILSRMFGILRMLEPYSYLDSYPLGSMGIGTPLALGACAALKEKGARRRAVLLTGDGSFGFYPGELSSMVQMAYDPIIIIANNGGWGNEMHMQPAKIGRLINAELGEVDYALVARGLGCEGMVVAEHCELDAALDQAFAQDGPMVVDVRIAEPPLAGRERTIIYDDLVAAKARFFSNP